MGQLDQTRGVMDENGTYHAAGSHKALEKFEPTFNLRFEKRKVKKLNLDGTQKYFRILQQEFVSEQGGSIWQDIPVVEARQ